MTTAAADRRRPSDWPERDYRRWPDSLERAHDEVCDGDDCTHYDTEEA